MVEQITDNALSVVWCGSMQYSVVYCGSMQYSAV